MKVCPKCQQNYPDNQGFCLNDGTALTFANAGGESEPETVMMNSTPPPTNPNQSFGNAAPPQNNWNAPQQSQFTPQPPVAPQKGGSKTWIWVIGILGVLLLLCGGGLVGAYFWLANRIDNTINTINTYSSPTPSTTNTATTATPSKTDSKLTMSKYNQVKNGMSYKEVVDILGVEGTETSNSEIGKYKTVSYKWDGENYSFIVATFQNDKLLFKTQYDLK